MSNLASPANGPVILCIMDGWGLRADREHNAVALANTPVYDELMLTYPTARLAASGPDVGLPEGQVGNSEVGHMNIGAGRVVMQDLPRINAAAADGSLAGHDALAALAATLSKTGGRAHLIGLLSDGGVHAHEDHFYAIASGLTAAGISVDIHAFTDGRDVLPRAAQRALPAFADRLPDGARIASITGRYFAMDRDNRWERTELAFNMITRASGAVGRFASVQAAVDDAYAQNESDEFIQPRLIDDFAGMQDGDALIMANFRGDRARQIMASFVAPDQVGFTATAPALCGVIGMSAYSDLIDPHMTILFPPQTIADGLGETVARAGKRQLRLAETEKYPHVTFFFNGGDEAVQESEDRTLVPSPKVATYDLQPEMSAEGVLAAALASVNDKMHDLLIINFANPDMVGHTGDLEAAIRAVETVDECVGTLVTALLAQDGHMLLTADHGNCEIMWDADAASPHTAHTTNLVPLIHISNTENGELQDGRLADLAPSLLALLDVPQPSAMTGRNLLG